MKLIIEISCKNGIMMEMNLNKAIDDLSKALKEKGFCEMELTAYSKTVESEPIYNVTIKK